MSENETAAVEGCEQECGYVYDHDAETVYEDDTVVQWVCHRCGAEGWEDLTEEPALTAAATQPAGDERKAGK